MHLELRNLILIFLSVLFPSSRADLSIPALPFQEKPAPHAGKNVFPEEAAVIEELRSSVRFENDGRGVAETIMRAKIQSESGVHENGLLTFSYLAANESLDIRYVRVRKPDGTLVETPLDSVQDLSSEVARSAPMYTDLREKHIAVRALAVGDLLEYDILATTTHPQAPGQFWYAYNFSKQAIALHQVLEINVPRDRPVKLKSPGLPPVVLETPDRRVYTFTTSHLKKDPAPDKWQLAIDGAPPPDVQLSSFKDWNDIASWYSALQKPRVQLTPELRARAEELTRDKKSDAEKMRAIYDFVSTRFRYISISFGQGRYAPHSAAEVLANGFGDCKDKHTLLAALLQAVHIDAYPVLIGTAAKMDPDMPTPAAFDHLITAVPQGASFLWLDSTSGAAPFAFLLKGLRDKLSLVILDSGNSLVAKTPLDPPFPLHKHFAMTATLDSNGTLDGKARLELRGDSEVLVRIAFRDTPQPNWKDLAQLLSATSGFAGTVDDVAISPPEDTSAPFWLTYSYHRPEYADWQNHHTILPFPALGLPELSPEESASPDAFPLGSPEDVIYEAKLTLPPSFMPFIPPSVTAKKDFAAYTSSYKLVGNVIEGRRDFHVLQPLVPAGQRSSYVSFYKAINEDADRWIPLSHGSAGLDADYFKSPSGNPESQRLFEEAAQSMTLGAPWAASKSFEKALKLDPTWTAAWIALGKARASAGDVDSAVTAFRKAILIEPSNRTAHASLAQALQSNYRRPEAIKAWRDLLAVHPDDPDAAFNLSDLLLASARYAEARPLLEKLLKNNDGVADLHLDLGQACINMGQEEDAVAHFRKALDLQPGSDMLNSVAFYLADANRLLPDALRYAQQAVRDTETATTVPDRTFGLMYSLAQQWDTLGWTYFRMGNFDLAEKYLSAAWNLLPVSDIGDHLGQVYEKRGDKLRARRAFRLALAALGVKGDPELRDKLLARISTGTSKSSSFFESQKELSGLSQFSVPRAALGDALFSVNFVKGPDPTAEFVRGSQELRSYAPAIASLKFPISFPDDGPTHITLRGNLDCVSQKPECIFSLFPNFETPSPPPQLH